MTTLQIPIHFYTFNSLYDDLNKKRSSFQLKFLQPNNYNSISRMKIGVYHQKGFKLRGVEDRRRSLFGVNREKDQILIGIERMKKKKKERALVVVKSNQGFGFNGGGGGGGGRGDDKKNTTRVLGFVAVGIGFTYLLVTGHIEWIWNILDALVSIGLLSVFLPMVAVGAYVWWASREVVEDNCPNCESGIRIFRTLATDPLLCPYCSQPFTVEGNGFIRATPTFYRNKSTTLGRAFNGFPASPEEGEGSPVSVVDIEAEVRDVD